LVRATLLHSEGRGFESLTVHNALVTELAYVQVSKTWFCGFDSHREHKSGNSSARLEHSLWERRVAGSNPVSPTEGQLAEWSIATVLKTVEPKGSESSNPSLSVYMSVAQLVEHWSPKPAVGGSIPSRHVKRSHGGTGRRTRLRIWRETVGVRLPLRACRA
jgi:hypothetical protein